MQAGVEGAAEAEGLLRRQIRRLGEEAVEGQMAHGVQRAQGVKRVQAALGERLLPAAAGDGPAELRMADGQVRHDEAGAAAEGAERFRGEAARAHVLRQGARLAHAGRIAGRRIATRRCQPMMTSENSSGR